MFVSFAMAGLFVMALVSFIVITQTNNDMDETILSNPILNKTYVDLGDELDTYKEDGEEQSLLQDEDDPLTEGGNLLFTSITGSGKVIKGMISGVYNSVVTIPAGILGVPKTVVGVLTGVLAILILLGAWRLYKAGE